MRDIIIHEYFGITLETYQLYRLAGQRVDGVTDDKAIKITVN